MSLSAHVDADDILEQARDHSNHLHLVDRKRSHVGHGGRYGTDPVPKFSVPPTGIDNEAAYQLITDELSRDGKPTLNLASFVHTYMPKEATQLVMDNINVNLCDQDEYPATLELHGRCVSMLADLWKAPKEVDENGKRQPAMGVATTGSSEAIMLGGLAMKRRWQEKRKAEGKSFKEPGPNVVFGSNAQVAIEKFACYFDVEQRLVPVSKESHYRIDPTKVLERCDENTIGVIVILGSTYTGHYEPVEEICKLLDGFQAKTGLDIPVHVDGASGGMVAPFAHPHLKWNFELERVKSINTSAHKFGMVYPGLGWIVFRETRLVPKDLVFRLEYLGSTEYSFGLNFSRPAAQVIAFYFNLITLGFKGFKEVMNSDLKNARLLSRALEKSGYYEVLSDIHKPVSSVYAAAAKLKLTDQSDAEFYEPGLPVVAFRWTDEFSQKYPHLEQRWMQTLLRARGGWIVPNYALSPDLEQMQTLRIVVRNNLSEDMIDSIVHDIVSITEDLIDRNSAAAHLALATAKKADPETGIKGDHRQAARTIVGGRQQPNKKHNQVPHENSKHATGFASQC